MTNFTNSSIKRTFQGKVDVPTDYYLETSTVGWLSVVLPEESINFVDNPSMKDINKDGLPDGFNWVGGTPVVIGQDGPYDINSINVTPTLPDTTLWYTGGFDTGTYTFSVVVKSNVPMEFVLQVSDGEALGVPLTLIAEKAFVSDEYWTQYSLTFESLSTPAISPNLIIKIPNSPTTGGTLEVGFWQTELKPYATTPFSGDFSGGRFEKADVYQWLGIPYASPSCRLADTYTGGRMVNLKELAGFRLTSIEGLGFAEQDVVFDALALQRGSILRCKNVTTRDVTLNGVLFGKSFRDLLCSRNELGKAIFSPSKERLFIMQLVDSNALGECSICSPCVQFTACYEGGFAGEWGSHFGEEVSIDLKLLQVEVSECHVRHEVLQVEQNLVHQVIASIDSDGAPKNPLLGHAAFTQPFFMNAMYVHPLDGNLYYDNSTGASSELWYYDGINNVKVADVAGGEIFRFYGVGRKLYIGGDFTFINGVGVYSGTSGVAIAELDVFTNTITNIGNVMNGGGNGTVRAITTDNDGVALYIGGIITDVDAFSGITNFAAMDIATVTWFIPRSSTGAPLRDLLLGTVGGSISDMVTRENGDIVAVGDFQNGNLGDGYGVATLEPNQTLVYHPLSQTHTRTDFSIDILLDTVMPVNTVTEYRGFIYLGGRFDLPVWSGSLANHIYNIAYLDFNQYSGFDEFNARLEPPVSIGLAKGLVDDGSVNDLEVCDGSLYVVGDFTYIGEVKDDGSGGIEDPSVPSHIPMCGGTVFTGLPTSGTFSQFPATIGDIVLPPALPACQIDFVTCGSKRTDTVLNIGVYTTNQVDATSSFGGFNEFNICADIDTNAKIFIEGPGQVEFVMVNGIIVNINRFIVTGESLVINGETIPVTASTSFSGNLGNIGLKLFKLNSDGINNILIKMAAGSTTVDTNAYVQYRRQSYSADILCSTAC